MRTTPAPERGAGSDDPTGRNLWQDRPDGNLWEGVVRTSFSVPTGLRFNSLSCGSQSSSRRRPEARAPAGNAQRRATRLTPSTAIVPIGAVGAGLGGAVATGGANAGRNHGRKQGLAPDPTGGAASRRDPNEKAVAGRCGAGRGGAVLDPRRLTVRRQPNGRERLSRAVRRRVRSGADSVRFAVDAVCCGKLGCGVEEPLLSVAVDGDSRVLCPDCAVEFVRGRSQ